MQTAVNSPSRLGEAQPVKEAQSPKILFVTPSSSGQLRIAKYFWELYRPKGFEAEFGTMENIPINPWLCKSMAELGFDLERDPIQTIFKISTISKDFQSIISLGGLENYCTLSPFVETLDVLFGSKPRKIYWDIPDPEYLSGEKDEMFQGAIEIRNRIELEIAQFSRSLAKTG